MSAEVPVRARRRGRGWIVLAVVLVVLVALFFVLDGVARSYASGLIKEKVQSALSLPADRPVDVEIGGVSVLAQLLTGKLEQIDIDAKQLSVGAVSGDVQLTARGVPISQDQPIDSANLLFSADQAELQKLLGTLSTSLKLPPSTVTIVGSDVQVATNFSVLGISIPVGITFAPSAIDGQLALKPVSVTISGSTLKPDAVGNRLGSLGSTVSQTQKICVASLLPAGFRLDSLRVQNGRLLLGVGADSVTLDSELFSSRGTCP